jgi:hypothetical protein
MPGISGQARLLWSVLYHRGILYSWELHDVGKSRGIGPIGKDWYHGLKLSRLARVSPPAECMVDNFLLRGPEFLT